MRFKVSERNSNLLLSLTAALFATAATAQDQTCADLAMPIQTKDAGVWFSEIDTDAALGVCRAEVAADPDNHAARAHLARVLTKLDDTAGAAQQLADIPDTTDPHAQTYWGVVHDNGYGGPVDTAKAVQYYELGWAQGNLLAANNLARILLDPDTQPHDPERGHAVRRAAAEQGGIFAASALAAALMYGRDGMEKDEAAAIPFFEMAAAGRSASAMADLGRAYRFGIGVEVDWPVAADWFQRGSDAGNGFASEYLGYMYRDGRGVPADIHRARALFELGGAQGRSSSYYALGREFQGAGDRERAVKYWRLAMEMGSTNAQERMGDAYYFGKGVPKDPVEAVRLTALAAAKGNPFAQERLADLLQAGIGVTRDRERATRLYQKAADQDRSYATYKLGQAYFNGYGVEKDDVRALELFKKAAELGSRDANVSIGYAYANGRGDELSFETALKYYEKAARDGLLLAISNMAELYQMGHVGDGADLVKAKETYKRAAQKGWLRAKRKLAEILIEEGTPGSLREAADWYLKGALKGDTKAVTRLEQGFADAEDPLHAALTTPLAEARTKFIDLGRRYEEVRVGCVILLVDCGALSRQNLDLARAAEWYRRAGNDPEAQFRLGRMLSAQPEAAQSDGEAADALRAAAESGNADAALWLALQDAPDAGAALRAELSRHDAPEAARLALLSVAGRFGDAAIGPGWTWLDTGAQAGDPDALEGIVGAALFLGAFDLAAEELSRVPGDVDLDLEQVDYTLRQALTFLMGAVRQGVTPDADQLDDMEALLTELDKRGQDGTKDLVLMLDEVRYRLSTRDSYEPFVDAEAAPPEAQLEVLDSRIADKSKGTGLSPLLVPLYMERARLLGQMEDVKEAEASVYRAMSIARSINDQSRHLQGSLVYHMEMACNERKGADLLFDLGIENAGLALAKSAVNHLQSARGKLLGLPQKLQNCFRDLLADQYRRMADLLIRNGHLDEAQVVLAQLKDFETFRYTGEAVDRLGQAFAPVPLTEEQTAIVARIHGLPIRDLIALEQQRDGLAEDDPDLEAVEAQIEEAHLALADSLDDLSDAVDALDTEASRDLSREVSARTLRRLAGRLDRLDSVAMVYSVSLPERTHFLIVTGAGTQHLELEVNRNDLNDRIEALRAALGNPAADPAPLARAFYDGVWADVDRALEVLEGEGQVLLVLDGRMRYVPIAALQGPDGWLVEGHRYVTFTPASRDLLLDDEEIGDLRVEALGASQGGDGFSPLPFVKQELASIVGLGTSQQALLDGRAWLDAGFDDGALEEALASGAPIIHVATHFDLTEEEASSRLLLGTGQTLSVSALKKGARRGAFDFADVQMLVLSACRTAFAGGSELESLATEMQYEGVRTVLATLWPVADQSTAAFMTAFYAELKDGAGRAEALQTVQERFTSGVQLAALDRNLRGAMSLWDEETEDYDGYAHPFYWAGFQMIGQWR